MGANAKEETKNRAQLKVLWAVVRPVSRSH